MSNGMPPFVDITKILEQFKLPGMDINAILEARRKDVEALTQANQIAYESMQALAQREAEILQQTMAEWQGAMAGMAGKSPQKWPRREPSLRRRRSAARSRTCASSPRWLRNRRRRPTRVLNRRFQENLEDCAS
jgi:hypothetical protein